MSSQTAPSARTIKDFLRRLGPAGPLAVMASVVPPLGSVLLLYYIQPVSQWLRGHAGIGPIIFAAAFVPLGGLNLLPTYVYSLLGGWAFGFWPGLLAAMSGIVLAALLAYAVGRKAAGERGGALLNENPKWRAVYEALLKGGFWKTLWIVTLLRFPPNSPFAISNLVLSTAKTRFVPYLLATLLGMAPRTAIVVWVGAHVGADEFKLADSQWLFWLGIISAVIVIAIIGKIAQDAVHRSLANSANLAPVEQS